MAPETKVRDSLDIVKIIKACRKNGVKELSIGDVKLVFSDSKAIEHKKPAGDTEISPVSPGLAQEVEQEAIKEAEVRLKNEEITNMLIENPFEMEQLIASGELVDETLQN